MSGPCAHCHCHAHDAHDARDALKLDLELGRYEHIFSPLNNRNSTIIEIGASKGDGRHHTQSIEVPPRVSVLQSNPPEPGFRKSPNPTPVGLFAFALPIFVMSMINCQFRGLTHTGVTVGLAYGHGGLIQILVGMWEIAVGNTFGATVSTSYGAFWISWALFETEGFGLSEGYSLSEKNNASGLYLMAWTIFTILMFFCTLRSNLALAGLFFSSIITFVVLTLGHFIQTPQGAQSTGIIKSGGYFGLVTSFFAWWCAAASLYDKSNSLFTVPVFPLRWNKKPEEDTKSG